jgi:DNA repair protein RadC
MNSETAAIYQVNRDDQIIAQALAILERRCAPGKQITKPTDAATFLTIRAAGREVEVFEAMWLNTQNAIIEVEQISSGTLSQTSVYPREVVKSALRLNAAAVIFTHNHPSGVTEPSRADVLLTQRLKQALELVDVRVLDHIITAGSDHVSMAERGEI